MLQFPFVREQILNSITLAKRIDYDADTKTMLCFHFVCYWDWSCIFLIRSVLCNLKTHAD